MATFQEAQQIALKLTPKKIVSDTFRFIRSIEKELAAYNRSTLFDDSEDIFGKPIGFYSYATQLATNGEKIKGDPFNLKDTGKFLEELYADVDEDSIFFSTRDPKLNKVMENLLSENIFGLQDDDLEKVISERVLPFLLDYFHKHLT